MSKHKGNYFYIYSIQISESHFEFNESSSSWQTNRFLETKKQKNLGLRIYLETHRPKIVFSVASAPRLYTQRERERERKRKKSVWGMASPKNSLFPFSRCFSAHNNIVFSFPFSFSLSHSLSLSLTRFPHCPLKPNSKEKQTNTHKYLSLSISLICHSTGLMRSSKRSSSRVCIIIIITLIISSPTTTKTTTAIAEQKPKPKLF